MKKVYKLLSAAILAASVPSASAQVTTQTINFTGSLQTFTVPACVSNLTLQLRGAQGASQTPGGTGGLGGFVSGVIAVSPGQVLNIYVGGQNGYNGGAVGGINGSTINAGPGVGIAGNGGGATDVRIGGVALADRVMVAGGGGGAARAGNWPGCQPAGPAGNGGAGGGLTGGAGSTGSSTACNCTNGGGNGGGGGTQVAGGATGTYNNIGCLSGWGAGSAGTLGNGGAGSNFVSNGHGGGGGGGGGYYGGGSGANGSNTTPGGGGGGGSSWTGAATSTVNTPGVQSGDGQVIISYNASAGVVITPTTTTLCSGASVTLTASGVNTYTWSNGSNSSSIVVTPTANITYTAQGTNSLSCVTSATTSITVNVSPTVGVSGNTLICGTGTNVLTASGADTYSWSTGAVTSSISASPTITTNYTVVGTSTLAGNCTNTFTTSILVSAVPNVSITGTGSICLGQSATLTANGANTYSWNTGSTSSLIVVSPTVTTTYSATGTNTAGCANTTTMSLLVSPCTGLAELNSTLSGLTIYPNPNNGEFTVELSNGFEKTVSVTDISGKTVYTNSSKNDKINVNIKDLSSGVYFVKIQSNNALQTVRILKQ